jgi:competence protein ComEC
MRNALIAIFFIGAIFTAGNLWSELAPSSSLKVAFFDVGQGDAIFFQTPQGHQVLIDGGPDNRVLMRLSEVMPFWDKSIDLVVLTHPDADHITGLVGVFERYEVESVLWTGKRKDTKVFAAFEKALLKEGAKEIVARAGERVLFGNSTVVLEVLYPFAASELEKEATNETSVIARLVYGEHEVLFTGDTTKKIEKRVLEQGANVEADILKVAHHGSKTSSSREFLEAVAPDVAVILVGKDNRYGHPSQETLANLAEYGIKIERTDVEGTIHYSFK